MENSNETIAHKYTYWDGADGDAMVCSPHGPTKHRTLCGFNQYGLGILITISGLWTLYLARRLGQLAQRIAPFTSGGRDRQRSSQAGKLHMKRLLTVYGLELIALAGMHLVNGVATVSASSTIQGSIGDLFCATTIALIVNHMLLQMRGTQAFRMLVQIPTDSSTRQTKKRLQLSNALDFTQSTGAFGIFWGVWVLVASGVMTRPTFLKTIYIFMTSFAIRTVFEDLIDRARTILRVDELQQNAGGDLVAKRRRRGILVKKVRALLFDMTALLFMNLALPMSVLVFRTTDSSTQILFHNTGFNSLLTIFTFAACISAHKQINKQFAKTRSSKPTRSQTPGAKTATGQFGQGEQTSEGEYTVAQESGLSVVGESETGGRPRKHSGGGLFSEVE
jgi:hypothetical protein